MLTYLRHRRRAAMNGSSALIASIFLVAGCGDPKAPILESDSTAIRALKEAGAQVMRLPIPGGATKEEVVVHVDLSSINPDAVVMGHVNAIPNVRELVLKGSKVDDATLALLKDSKALYQLDLTGSKVTDAGLKEFASKSFPALYMLILDSTQVTGEGLASLPSRLGGLSLAKLPIQDGDLKHLQSLKRLEAVTLTGTKVTPAGVAALRNGKLLPMVMGIKTN